MRPDIFWFGSVGCLWLNVSRVRAFPLVGMVVLAYFGRLKNSRYSASITVLWRMIMKSKWSSTVWNSESVKHSLRYLRLYMEFLDIVAPLFEFHCWSFCKAASVTVWKPIPCLLPARKSFTVRLGWHGDSFAFFYTKCWRWNRCT